jgi:hypothetical protein
VNALALVEAMLRRSIAVREPFTLVELLKDAARDLGLSDDEIDAALYDERDLVIYEP